MLAVKASRCQAVYLAVVSDEGGGEEGGGEEGEEGDDVLATPKREGTCSTTSCQIPNLQCIVFVPLSIAFHLVLVALPPIPPTL